MVQKGGKAIRSGKEEDLYEASNLSPETTGLPFVVWISVRMGARHDVRVRVSPGPVVSSSSELVSVAIRPTVRVVVGSMKASDLALLKLVILNLVRMPSQRSSL